MPHKRLFTPGPILTSRTVKEAMLVDMGSRDEDFLEVIQFIKEKLLELAGNERINILTALFKFRKDTFLKFEFKY